MLNLEAKAGERTYIVNEDTGEVVHFSVVQIGSNQFQLSIHGPRSYSFLREEKWHQRLENSQGDGY